MNCPICFMDGVVTEYKGGYHKYACHNCGRFMLDTIAHKFFADKNDGAPIAEDRNYLLKCASVMLERNLKRLNEYVLIGASVAKGLYFCDTGVPMSTLYPTRGYDKLKRGFLNIVRALPGSYFRPFYFRTLKYDPRSLLFICDDNENPLDLMTLMINEGWVAKPANGPYSLTIKGMQLFEEESLSSDNANAFLAMWFGVDGNKMFREAVENGVARAGYHLQVVDEEQYNGFIMDKIVNLINDSAFVIADLSAMPEKIDGDNILNGVRGGVYWEAGYAAGQKKQVIVTCKDDAEALRRVHFDLQQHNQIRWRIEAGKVVTAEENDLADAIEQRVLATVGSIRG